MRFSAMSRNGGDVLVLPALSGQQHDAGSLLNSSLDAAPAKFFGQPLDLEPFLDAGTRHASVNASRPAMRHWFMRL
jgi:hypothetical protein